MTEAHLLMSFPLFPLVQDWGPPTAALAAALGKFIQFSQIVDVFQTSLCLLVFPSQLFPLCPLMTSYMHGRSLFSEIDPYKFVVQTFHAFVILITRTHAQENFVITFVIFRKHITVFRSHIGKLNFGGK